MKRNRKKDLGNRHSDRFSSLDDLFEGDFGAIESDDFDDVETEEVQHGKRRFDHKRWRDELIERSSERQRMRDRDLRRGLYKHSSRDAFIDEATELDSF